MADTNLTLDRLKELLDYNLQTGLFIWKCRTSNRVKVGDVAGRNNGNGYVRIAIDGKNYYAHRLAWMFVHGEIPALEIDHADGNRSNNKIENLRLASHAENGQNQALRATNTSGMIGVSWSKAHGMWCAYIFKSGKKKHLGLFKDLDEAGAAYLSAKAVMHSFQQSPRGARDA